MRNHTLAGGVSLLLLTTFSNIGSAQSTFTIPATGDPSYKIIRNEMKDEPSTTAVVVTKLPSWGPNTLGAPWIAPDADQTNADRPGTCCISDPNGTNGNNGFILYTTTFSLNGLDPTTAKVSLNLMADDYVNVIMNPQADGSGGTRVFSATSGAMYLTPTRITIVSGFKPGVNTLEFEVHNFGGPTGLSVAAATGTASPAYTGPPSFSLSLNNVVGSSVTGTDSYDSTFPIAATYKSAAGTQVPISFAFPDAKSTPPTCTTQTPPSQVQPPPLPFLILIPSQNPTTNGVGPAFTIRLWGLDLNGNPIPPGRYTMDLRVTATTPGGALTQDLCVNSVVTTNPTPNFTLSGSGLYFSSLTNGTPPDQAVSLFESGANVSWTAKIKPLTKGDNFMTITPTSGTANTQAGTVGSTITVHMNPQSSAGVHYAAIVITPQAPSTLGPQVIVVVYNVYNSGSVPNISPPALIYSGSFPSQSFTILPAGTAAQSWSATALSPFIKLTTPSGTISGSAVPVPVGIDQTKLSLGFNLGFVSVTIGSNTQLLTVLAVETGGTATVALPAGVMRGAVQASCVPSDIAVLSTSLPGGFSTSAGWPVNFTVQVVDDCANPIANASAFLSFSDTEASIPLTLADASTGTYAATWSPATTGPITLTVGASSGSFAAQTTISGTVAGNNAPRIAPHGTLSNLNPQVGAPLAPGSVASIYGSNLAGGTPAGSPGVSPLLTAFQGITVNIGGIDVPIYYVSDGQLNVQIPYELAPGGTYPVVVSTNNGVSVPDNINLADVAPGVAVYADGTLIAQHLDYSLVNANSPAAPKETLQMYLVGLGATNPAVATNTPAPSAEPLARVANVTVTVNGENSTVAYAGLTPASIGLYQIDFAIPPDITTSSPTVIISVNGIQANQTSVPVVAK